MFLGSTTGITTTTTTTTAQMATTTTTTILLGCDSIEINLVICNYEFCQVPLQNIYQCQQKGLFDFCVDITEE